MPFPNFHAIRIKDPGDFEEGSFRTKEIGKEGIEIIMGKLKGQDSMTTQAYRFPKDKFDMEQVHKWLKDNNVTDIIKEEPAKEQNASGDLTYEYLLSFYNYAKNHENILDQFKNDIHIKARASAGGQLKGRKSAIEEPLMDKISNASPSGGKIVYEDDDMIEVPVVVMKEGKFTGTNGIEQQKLFEEFKDSALKRLNGVPILPYHVPGMVTAQHRWLGQLKDVRARPDTKDIAATARFYKNTLTPEELAKIKSLTPFDGSIGYTCNLDSSSGQVIEKGPYNFNEFAMVDKGACSVDHGCGFFQNEAAPDKVGEDEAKVVLDDKVEESEKSITSELDYAKMIADAFGPIEAQVNAVLKDRGLA